MKVRELIARLEKLDQDAEVFISPTAYGIQDQYVMLPALEVSRAPIANIVFIRDWTE